MKNKLLLLVSILFSLGVAAQDRYTYSEPAGYTSLNEAGQMAEEIVKASGMTANFAIMEANVENALAVVQNGKRYILYNPRFIAALTRATGNKWAAVSVFAHEIGHHLYRKPNSERSLATELEADEFSGLVLAKMGASLNDAEAAMKLLATTRATATHPAGVDRINSIAAGWKKGGGDESEIGQQEEQEDVRDAMPANAIAATIRFNSNPGTDYYVTKQWQVIRSGDNGTKLIAHMTRSNSNAYPYVIFDDTGYKLYVGRNGVIITEGGKVVGRMQAWG